LPRLAPGAATSKTGVDRFNALQLDAAGEESLAGDFRAAREAYPGPLDMVRAASGCTRARFARSRRTLICRR
jgi:hypothetical protein